MLESKIKLLHFHSYSNLLIYGVLHFHSYELNDFISSSCLNGKRERASNSKFKGVFVRPEAQKYFVAIWVILLINHRLARDPNPKIIYNFENSESFITNQLLKLTDKRSYSFANYVSYYTHGTFFI